MSAVLPRSTPEPDVGARSRPGARSLRRRRPLPSSRAVAGGFLVAAAATLVLTAWLATTGTHGQRWVVARRTVAAGASLEPGDLATESMTLPRGATAAGAFRSADALSGRILAAPLEPGELVQQGTLVQTGQQPDLRPVTVSVDAPDATDLASGSRVDVLVTDGSGNRSSTSVVIRGARVLAVVSPGSSLLASSSGDEVTLGVHNLAEVETLVHAAHSGTLSVVVGERSDGTGLGPPPKAPPPTQAPPPSTDANQPAGPKQSS